MFAYLKKVVPHVSKGIHSFQIEWEITGTEIQGIPVSLCFILNAQDYISLFSELLSLGGGNFGKITKIRRIFVQSDLDHQLLGGSFNDLARICFTNCIISCLFYDTVNRSCFNPEVWSKSLARKQHSHDSLMWTQQKRCCCNRVLDILQAKSLQQNALPWYCWLKKYCTTWDGAKAL